MNVICLDTYTVKGLTNKLIDLPIKPGQAASIPQGWWHYAVATKDDTHILATHDAPELYTVWGSDILRIMPPQILAQAYCLNEQQVHDTLAPIKDTVIIGPSNDCQKGKESGNQNASYAHPYRAEDPMQSASPHYYSQPTHAQKP